MIGKRLKNFLDHEKVHYEILPHPERFTAQEIAAAEHTRGKEVAKVVMVKAEGKDIMAVVPATAKVDLFKLSKILGTEKIEVEQEKDFGNLFPDCEPGAMPPFGSLYNLPCYVDGTLLKEREIVFNGGNHQESVKISTKDFEKIAHAKIEDIAVAVGSGRW
jgi:Ala-tRNA(Pro) deacylase